MPLGASALGAAGVYCRCSSLWRCWLSWSSIFLPSSLPMTSVRTFPMTLLWMVRPPFVLLSSSALMALMVLFIGAVSSRSAWCVVGACSEAEVVASARTKLMGLELSEVHLALGGAGILAPHGVRTALGVPRGAGTVEVQEGTQRFRLLDV